jgi:hypothetical protein
MIDMPPAFDQTLESEPGCHTQGRVLTDRPLRFGLPVEITEIQARSRAELLMIAKVRAAFSSRRMGFILEKPEKP